MRGEGSSVPTMRGVPWPRCLCSLYPSRGVRLPMHDGMVAEPNSSSPADKVVLFSEAQRSVVQRDG